jgi:hypothetical protein
MVTARLVSTSHTFVRSNRADAALPPAQGIGESLSSGLPGRGDRRERNYQHGNKQRLAHG